ncbi:MAG: GNAT family N-acetyltransferase [Acidiferrobacteraceae bacterium]|nr:GNAT family N-acetyltransferase [Acidiferrobacteraceae bacterium]|tara:strand:- start:7621 stop:8079 length:459 start_codon:yes stop_codon:yes gene_type:complete
MIKVRKAKVDDVDQIHNLLLLYSTTGQLLPRSHQEIQKTYDTFLISEENNIFAGCASLEIFTTDLAEVRSLAVDPKFTKSGHGRLLVKKIEEEANSRSLKRLIALTYVPNFFEKLGFEITSMENLPEKVFGICVRCPKFNHCDELAVIKYLG